MPTVKEYRVAMPLSMEEMQRARQWHRLEQMKLEKNLLEDASVKVTDFGERVLQREQITELPTFFSGKPIPPMMDVEHVVKGFGSLCSVPVMFPLLARIGSWFDVMISTSIRLTEVNAWEAYPYFSSVSTNSSLRDHYKMIIEGVYFNGNVTAPDCNPLELSESMLEDRELVIVDIAENVALDDYRDGKDPVLFFSEKTARGPLTPGKWIQETEPVITCAIVVSIHFDLLGPMGSIAEKRLHLGIERAMRLHHRELFCYIDRWIDEPLSALIQSGREIQEEVELLIEQKLGGAAVCTPRLPHDDAEVDVDGLQKEKKTSFVQTVTSCSCPVTFVKNTVGSVMNCCNPKMCGGSVGYSWLMIGMVFCLVAWGVTVIVKANLVI